MINRKGARKFGALLGALAVAGAIAAYLGETSITLKSDLVVLMIAIVVGVGILTARK